MPTIERLKFSHIHGLPDDERARLPVIFDELLTNVMPYAYEGAVSEGHVEVALSLEENRLIMEFIDDGRPFDPVAPRPIWICRWLSGRSVGWASRSSVVTQFEIWVVGDHRG